MNNLSVSSPGNYNACHCRYHLKFPKLWDLPYPPKKLMKGSSGNVSVFLALVNVFPIIRSNLEVKVDTMSTVSSGGSRKQPSQHFSFFFSQTALLFLPDQMSSSMIGLRSPSELSHSEAGRFSPQVFSLEPNWLSHELRLDLVIQLSTKWLEPFCHLSFWFWRKAHLFPVQFSNSLREWYYIEPFCMLCVMPVSTCQSGGGIFSVEVPSPQITLACIKLTEI